MIGKTISHYEIIELLGKGGMGEVYRAQDTKLGRDVAIKVLPLDLAADPERLARFRREAKLLASLSHPNIAGIHGLEVADDRHFLVMELAEGEDLAQRLQRGPIPLDEALEISRQIAEGLEEAHEKGIVHRDLKPGNIRLGPGGEVKILDFGLARAFVDENLDEENLHNSPTISAAMTQPGVVLGTAAYMSPEQAKGRTVDRRADLWSFGAILWEMLTGQRLFSGETVSDTLAAVLRADPPYDELPEGTPPAVVRLLERCLERDPRKRLRDVGEARIRLQRWQEDPSTLQQSDPSLLMVPQPSPLLRRLPWALAALGIVAALLLLIFRPQPVVEEPPSLALEIRLLDEDRLQEDVATNVLISPDGELLAYLAANRIHLRRLDERETRTIDGTQDPRIACFSPDGKWLAFTSRGKIYRISVTGGSPVEICDAPDSRGLCWVNESTLVFNPTFASALQKVSLSDGVARPLTELQEGERSHRWPHALPDGKSVLFLCQYFGRDYDEGDIIQLDLESGERRVVYRGGASPRYSESGHLLFARNDVVFAIPFDPATGETHGLATPVLDHVWTSVGDQEICDGSAQFDLSRDGTLVYRQAPGDFSKTQLTWIDLETGETTPMGGWGIQNSPVISPDGTRLAVTKGDQYNPNVFIFDIATGTETRLSFAEGANQLGCWSPDDRFIYYTRPTEQGIYVIYRKPADGSGVEEEVVRTDQTVNANAVSPDGSTLYVTVWGGAQLWDVGTVDLRDPEAEIQTLVSGPEMQYYPTLSPDGSWIAYIQNLSEVWQIYLRRIPDTGGQWEILQTDNDIQQLRWSGDGTKILTRDGRGFFEIPLEFVANSVRSRSPVLLQPDDGVQLGAYPSSDCLPDGSRGVYLRGEEDAGNREVGQKPPVVLITRFYERIARSLPNKS